MPLVSKDFNFTGKHAIMVEELKQSGTFEYLWQIFVVAPIIGFIYKRKADNDPGENKTIFLSQLSPRQSDIYFIYKLILLADKVNCESSEERIKKAFMTIDTEEAKPDEQLFYSYLLGGVEVLHEKLLEKSSDLFKNLGSFLSEITISDDSIFSEVFKCFSFCRTARVYSRPRHGSIHRAL